MALDPSPIRAIDGQIGEPVGVFVAGAQRVADREAAELSHHHLRLRKKRHEVRVLHAVLPEHLLDEQERVADDFQLVRSLLVSRGQSLQQAGVLRDVVGGSAEEATDLDDLGVGAKDDAVARWAGIAARRSVDECDELFQDMGFSR